MHNPVLPRSRLWMENFLPSVIFIKKNRPESSVHTLIKHTLTFSCQTEKDVEDGATDESADEGSSVSEDEVSESGEPCDMREARDTGGASDADEDGVGGDLCEGGGDESDYEGLAEDTLKVYNASLLYTE